ncbi:MAG: hypothetical protein GQ533_15140 [Methanosarcinaceae archaeon]|nr:hypothetical protein [Methanosarcinaceae archaeon]
MKNSRLQIITFLTIVSLLALTITSGCLETPEATPAKVSSEALSEYGWVRIGDVAYESQEEEISGTVIKVNTAMIMYQDEQLGQDMLAELSKLQSQYNVQVDAQLPTVGSQLMTLRVVLPGGIGLPSSATSSLIDSQIDKMAGENNIENFKKVGTREITVNDGSVITANTYSGTTALDGDVNDATIDVMVIIAPWSSSGSNIFAIGVVPDGDINLTMEPIEKTIITINGDDEIDDIVEMIKTIN